MLLMDVKHEWFPFVNRVRKRTRAFTKEPQALHVLSPFKLYYKVYKRR